jgi:ABC-type branched-subunit amino acid transport system substrate-binding protein
VREPKPHVVSFLASMLLVAGFATVLDRPESAENVAITVESVTTDQNDDSTSAGEPVAQATPDGSPSASPDGASPSVGPSSTPGLTPTTSGGQSNAAPPSAAPASATETTPYQSTTPTYPEAPLYDDEQKVRGFSATDITMCGHAALALGAAFDTSREDLNVYWDMVNDRGGIHGRDVTMTWEDDAYVASQAITAAETCAGKDPFMILGGIGFDQIPGVRDWAETNNELYLHHIAVAPTQTYNYSYSLSPTVELTGTEFGNYLAGTYADKSIGVLYRDTANWSPGSDAGKAVLEAKGVEYRDYPILQNQGVYSQQLNDMQLNGVEVVWVWENALNAAQILNQADEQGYFPTWVVFPFQTTIDILTDPSAHSIDGVAAWPAYAKGGYGGKFPEYDVDPEIARFEAAYAKFRPGSTPNDLLWQVWIGNKVFEQMLLDCGVDCNRNRFAGMMLSGYQQQVKPACAVNFADKRSFGNHHGGFGFFTQKLFFPESGPAYETTRYCARTLA